MIKRLVNIYITARIKRASHLKWKEIVKAKPAGKPDKSLLTEYARHWQALGSAKPYYQICYTAISKIADSRYVPEDLYYTRLEPTLNNRSFALAYADKNFYQKFLPEHADLFPKTYLRCINGVWMDEQYNSISKADRISSYFEEGTAYIFKPSVETSGGSNVSILHYAKGLFYINNGIGLTEQDLLKQLSRYRNFIIQEKIIQKEWFSDFNPSSLNTIRVFTYRSVKDNAVHVLSSVIRFGKPGSIVDNQAAGGYTCGINAEGLLNNFACGKLGRLAETPEAVKIKAKQAVPGYTRLLEHARLIAPVYGYHRLLGFDFCMDNNNQVKLLEINCKNIEINFLQMNNGPLFGNMTEEVVDYCSRHQKNLVLDFEI